MTVPSRRYRVVVCRGPECGDNRGSAAIHAAFQVEIAARGLAGRVELGWQSCFGRCRQGPNVLVHAVDAAPRTSFLLAVAPLAAGANGALYNGLTVADVPRILDEHVLLGRPCRDLVKKPDYGTIVGETLRTPPEGKGGSGR